MKFQLDSGIGTFAIRGYRKQAIAVNDEELTSSFVICPEHLIKDWGPRCAQDLTPEHMATLAALDPEIVILGTGHSLIFPPSALAAPLHDRQIGVEIMDTLAACRIYTVLMSEGRKVVAGMIINAEI